MISLHNDIFFTSVRIDKNSVLIKEDDFELLLSGRGRFFGIVLKIKGATGPTSTCKAAEQSVSENHTHLRTCMKSTHRSTSRTLAWHADAPNQYQTIPGVHPNRCDRQSASTPSAINHTFRYFGAINYISSTEEKHHLDQCIQASYPVHQLAPCLLRKVNVDGRIQKVYNVKNKNQRKKFNLDKVDGENRSGLDDI